MEKNWFKIVGLDFAESQPVEIYFYGAIELSGPENERATMKGVQVKAFLDEFEKIPTNRKIILRMDSPGGSFFGGLQIAKAIKARGNVQCLVDGTCYSMATIVAIACDKVQATKNSSFIIHEARLVGETDGMKSGVLRDLANTLDTATKEMLDWYVAKTGKTQTEVMARMVSEAPMSAEEALEFGLIDEILTARKKIMANKKDDTLLNEQKKPATIVGQGGDTQEPTAPVQVPPSTKMEEPLSTAHDPSKEANEQIKALEAKVHKMRLEKITEVVEKACSDGKIENTDIAGWVKDCMASDSVIERLKALPTIKQRPIDLIGSGKVLAGEDSIDDIAKHAKQIVGMEKSLYLRKHGDKILEMLKCESTEALHARSKGYKIEGAILVDPSLKLDFIQDRIIEEFHRVNGRVDKVCTTRFDATKMQWGNKTVIVPILPIGSRDVKQFEGEYNFTRTPTNGSAMVTLNKRPYVELSTSSADIIEQPWLMKEKHLLNCAIDLSNKIWDDVMALIIAANFPNVSTKGKVEANAFDHTTLAGLRREVDQLKWPKRDRCLILNGEYNLQICVDPVFSNASAIGGASSIREDNIVNSYGFGYYEYNEEIPDNDENLYGFCCLSGGDAILMPSTPITPPADAAGQVNWYVGPTPDDGGTPVVFRNWFEPKVDRSVYIIEANYGLAPGNTAALMRLVTA